MNKNAAKRNKEKQDTNCIIKDNISEQKNGFVNGVVSHTATNKKNKKGKKHKNPAKSAENSAEEKCKEKPDHLNRFSENEETKEPTSDIVHNVEETKGSNDDSAKLDSNENLSKNEENRKASENPPVPSCSNAKDVTKENQQNMLEISKDLDKLELECSTQIPQPKIEFVQYESEEQMPMIMKIIQKDLSEPYSIYTYRYFIHNWPNLCFLAMCEGHCVGAIVCKLDLHRKVIKRGYIAMLAVDQNYRKLRIGSTLVQMAIQEMIVGDADEVVLETEVTNKPALQLYEKLGFVRDKRLFRYYLNGVDALRLKLWLR